MFLLRTRQAFVAHRRKKSLLTVKESLADSGRSSKTSGSSSGRRLKDREDREDRENQQQQQLLVAASPSDFLQETAVSLTAAQQQFGSFYLRLGTVSKFPPSPSPLMSHHNSPQCLASAASSTSVSRWEGCSLSASTATTSSPAGRFSTSSDQASRSSSSSCRCTSCSSATR